MNKYLKEKIFKGLMYVSMALILASLMMIIGINLVKGGLVLLKEPSLIWTMPSSRYLLGGEGGIAHAILGSLFMVIPATVIATVVGYLIAVFMQVDYVKNRFADKIRLMLDILWGIPSILYGIFVLNILILFNWRSCLLAGMITLALLELPILTRYMDEALGSVPHGIREAMYSMGATKLESAGTSRKYAMSGLTAGVLMGIGRAMGDAASVTFTAGAGNTAPTGLFASATALPVLIYLQSNSFYPSVRDHAYAASCILVLLVVGLNLLSRAATRHFSKYTTMGGK